jgi:uncharacterized membrane protein
MEDKKLKISGIILLIVGFIANCFAIAALLVAFIKVNNNNGYDKSLITTGIVLYLVAIALIILGLLAFVRLRSRQK